MKIAVGTAHLTVVNIPEKGVERRSNQGKSGKTDACLHPRSSKIFVYQPISTKFNAKVTVGMLHIPIVKVRGERVGGRSNQGKVGKIMVFDIPGPLISLLTNRFRPKPHRMQGFRKVWPPLSGHGGDTFRGPPPTNFLVSQMNVCRRIASV
jgi:hypothetical protein